MAHAVAWCLMAPSHYLNQHCPIIKGVLWHSPKGNFTRPYHDINSQYVFRDYSFNSLAPGWFERNLRKVIFKLILMIGSWGIFCKFALRWMSMDLTDKSTLVQVMACCHQATSHYLSQCWPRSMSPYGVTRPQWVKITTTSPRVQWVNSNVVPMSNPQSGTKSKEISSYI